MSIAVVASSLVKPGELGTWEKQRANLSVTCEGLAAVMAAGYRVVVTHATAGRWAPRCCARKWPRRTSLPSLCMLAWLERKLPAGTSCNRSSRRLFSARRKLKLEHVLKSELRSNPQPGRKQRQRIEMRTPSKLLK